MASSAAPDKQNEDVMRWLAQLERGLRGDEGARLREWLKNKTNRTQILDAARLWHGPEIVAVLAGLVPQAELVGRKTQHRRRFNMILGWSALVLIVGAGVGSMTGLVKLPIDETRLLAARGVY